MYGTFEKNGISRVAYSPADAVKFKFDGWQRTDEDQADEASVVEDDQSGPPPMVGTGSGTDAWAGYAASLGVDVAEDAKRGEIVDAIRTAGHPVEQQ